MEVLAKTIRNQLQNDRHSGPSFRWNHQHYQQDVYAVRNSCYAFLLHLVYHVNKIIQRRNADPCQDQKNKKEAPKRLVKEILRRV